MYKKFCNKLKTNTKKAKLNNKQNRKIHSDIVPKKTTKNKKKAMQRKTKQNFQIPSKIYNPKQKQDIVSHCNVCCIVCCQ